MINDEALIQRTFHKFRIEEIEFYVNIQLMIQKTQDYVAYVASLVKNSPKYENILLYVYNQSWGQMPFIINNYQKFSIVNKCPYILKHYAIGIINTIVGLATSFHSGITIQKALQNGQITSKQLLESLQIYMKGIEYLYNNKINHDNVNLQNMLLINGESDQQEYTAVLGPMKIIVLKENIFEIKYNDFQQLGWALIQLFCKYSDQEIHSYKKQHSRKKYKNDSIPDNLLEILNNLIEKQFTSEEDYYKNHYEQTCAQFYKICNTESMLIFTQQVINSYKQEQQNENNIQNTIQNQIQSVTMHSNIERKKQIFQNQKSYLLSSCYYKQEELLRAEVFGEEQNFEEANKIYRNLINLSHQQDSTPLYYLSYNLIEQNQQSNEIIENLLKAIEINPQHSQMFHCLGLQYFNRKELSLSMIYIEKSLKLNNFNADCYHTYGKILAQNKDFKASKQALLKSTQINPAYGGYFDIAYANILLKFRQPL
ncbi:tetratricopeptide repeat protein (macronuclear) [Tetrahymena thermophila SB210]|uniref:Tetratricopeptide repeat protein n=1 Tax=Tetrahymena thermophila (strain SB210) TaxID=312017 RepID=Q22DR9_TETTS|nr:tetratricopeptide repeat protein [Tetrahymena thermophila SB210]EAR83385.2 tetratricopeptide repeat protein [Tetrahymena thermophila SB210]|eukprot:XP_001031048.2 tetratricopeptide repeat protein [Tetrahymena thermophila SB210]